MRTRQPLHLGLAAAAACCISLVDAASIPEAVTEATSEAIIVERKRSSLLRRPRRRRIDNLGLRERGQPLPRNLLADDRATAATSTATGGEEDEPLVKIEQEVQKVRSQRARAKALYEAEHHQQEGRAASTAASSSAVHQQQPHQHEEEPPGDDSVSLAAATAGARHRTSTRDPTDQSMPISAERQQAPEEELPLPRVVLERHRRKWLEQQLDYTEYRFEYTASGGSAPGADGMAGLKPTSGGGTVIIHVVDGSVGYATTPNGQLIPSALTSQLPTINDIFDLLANLYERHPAKDHEKRIKVEYDRVLGYPSGIMYSSPSLGKESEDGIMEGGMTVEVRNLVKEGDGGNRVKKGGTESGYGPSQSVGNPNNPTNNNVKTSINTNNKSNQNPFLDNLSYHQTRWFNFQYIDYDYTLTIGKRRTRRKRRSERGVKIQVHNGKAVNTPRNDVGSAMSTFLKCVSGEHNVGGGVTRPNLPTMEEVYTFLNTSYRKTPRRKRRRVRITYNSEVSYPNYVRIPVSCSANGPTNRHKMISLNIRNVNMLKEGGTSTPDMVNPDPNFDDKVKGAYDKWVDWSYTGANTNYWFKYERECELGMPPEECVPMCVTVKDGRADDVRYAKQDSNNDDAALFGAESVCDSIADVPEDLAESIPTITELLELLMQTSSGGARTIAGSFDDTWGYPKSGHVVNRPDTSMPFRFQIKAFDLVYPSTPTGGGGDNDRPDMVAPGMDTFCPADVRVCPNTNKVVVRVLPDCKFVPCEDGELLPSGCDATPFTCDDDTLIYKLGVPPNCAYPPCTPPGVHDPKDVVLLHAQDLPPTLGSDGKPLTCPMITQLCDDGVTYVALDSKKDCRQYEPCPNGEAPSVPVGGPELVSGAPPGIQGGIGWDSSTRLRPVGNGMSMARPKNEGVQHLASDHHDFEPMGPSK